ncbi:MAG: hypothetical protein K5863_22250 [Nitratireductor sp.]|uniref:hypothetical protein n=1 Tax=Nitratireductor sp. TaxID=1872084 RepID=UPI00261ABA7D|nr:hypothetical protein [Nitratireductor sp.]MCV0352807.1 hypothetical protein [Nitratireductor sp.]
MTDTMLPILRQMHDAEDNRALALLLLAAPDMILSKYQGVIHSICRKRQFEPGEAYLELRLNAMRSVRDGQGRLKPAVAHALAEFGAQLGAFADGGRT